jgi:hypothetical protein
MNYIEYHYIKVSLQFAMLKEGANNVEKSHREYPDFAGTSMISIFQNN